jgi:hypothetical protein
MAVGLGEGRQFVFGLYGDLVTADEDRANAASGRAGAGHGVLLAVRFATELAMLAVLAVAGAHVSAGLAWRVGFAVAGPVLAAVVWGLVIAPRAARRLGDPLRLAIETVMFLAASAALALAGDVIAASAFAVIAIGTAVVLRIVAPGP